MKKINLILSSVLLVASLLIIAGSNIFHIHDSQNETEHCSVCILNSFIITNPGLQAFSSYSLHENNIYFMRFEKEEYVINDYTACLYSDRAPPVI